MIFHFRPIPRKAKKRVFSRLCRIGERCIFTDKGRHAKRGCKGRLPALILFQSRTHNQISLAMRHADEYEALLFALPYFRLGYIPLRSIIPSLIVFEKERDDDKQ